jgi:O-antigen ligase
MFMVICVSKAEISAIRSYFMPHERILMVWAVLSSIWSISHIESAMIALQLMFVIIMSHILTNKTNIFVDKTKNLIKRITFGIVAAAIIFSIEAFTDGMLYRLVRGIVQPNSNRHFEYSWLDRGCSVLSVCAWALIYLLVNAKKHLKAFILYSAIFILLLASDSTASFVAFILGGIAYIAVYFSPRIMGFLLALSVIAYMVIMPIFSLKHDPREITSEYKKIPISYAHRLFIWKFTATKSMEDPLIGKGIGSSKLVPVLDSDIVPYLQYNLSPLPRHPHNNVLQIWLEMGAIGLAIAGAYVWNILGQLRSLSKKNPNFGAATHAVFINYFFIGMVSFNIWQSWWMMVALFMILLMNIVRHNE